jgi:hypothetical protein
MGSLADLAKLSNVSLYGFEDYHGVDIGVVRAVRIWYAPIAGEMTLEIKLLDSDTRLGFAISRTDEVICIFLSNNLGLIISHLVLVGILLAPLTSTLHKIYSL